MTARRLLALSVVTVLAWSQPAQSGEQPYQLARALQFLQENITLGSRASQEAQQKLLVQMTEQYLAADRDVWRDPKNFSAAIIHALSGGDPAVLKALIARGLIAQADLPLAQGTLAYAEGRSTEAADLLGTIDASKLTPALGGYVALTQSALIADKDPKKTGQLLDLARLLMPGTLVEEASLRREITAVVRDGDIEKFERLSRQQITRYSRSLYSSGFRQQFAEALIKLDYGAGSARLPMIADMLTALPPQDQRELYLIIAHRSVTAGKMAIARFAADHAATLTAGAGADEARAQLYAAAALIVTDDFDAALKQLKAIDANNLTGDDAELLTSALAIATRLRQWPQPEPSVPANVAGDDGSQGSEAKAIAALTERVMAALTRTDEFLKEPTQ